MWSVYPALELSLDQGQVKEGVGDIDVNWEAKRIGSAPTEN